MRKKSDSLNYHQVALARVASTTQPINQKYDGGTRVSIIVNDRIRTATVLYTYAHAFSGNDYKHYALDIDGIGYSAWYMEDRLTLI